MPQRDVDEFVKGRERPDRKPIEHNDTCRSCYSNIRWWSYPKQEPKVTRPRFLLCCVCTRDYFELMREQEKEQQ